MSLTGKKEFKSQLKLIGDYINNNNMRVSMHPGQYTVLNSPKEEVVKNAMADLIYHCDFLDSLGLNSAHKIVLHCGGVYQNKNKSLQRLKEKCTIFIKVCSR